MDKKTKKIIISLAIVLLLLLFAFAVRFIFGGPEDSWICSNGDWIKHGNPLSAMPQEICN